MDKAPQVKLRSTSHYFLEGLNEIAVDHLFCNLGTDHAPVIEEMARWRKEGRRHPPTVLCPHENVAVHMAAGYTMVTGRGQAILVHVDVGTANSAMALHNLARARIPALLMAGRAPFTVRGELPGSRDNQVHFIQEPYDQAGLVRPYVKWEYNLHSGVTTKEVLRRAHSLMHSDPMGPVYLTLPREVLMTEVGEVKQPAPALTAPARLGAGDPDALRDVAQHLVRSERPVVLTSTSGRTRQGFEALVKLATLLALPVVERRERTNFPTSHPLHQGFLPGPFVETADVILVVDSDVPYIPTQVTPRSDATIVQIDVDPIKERIPLWSFPLTSAIRADSARALELVAGYAAELLTDGDKARIETRRAELTARHNERRAARKASAQAMQTTRPLTAEWLGYCIGQLQREAPECVFVDESLTSHGAVWNHVDTDEPGTMFGSGGSSLGWGLGAALGIKLARPDRPVVLVVGDGSFIFGEPLAAIWASQMNQAPILAIVFNNGAYNANKAPLISAYPKGYSVQGRHFVGTDLAPSPRYDLLAAVVGAVGERVEDPVEVLPALRRGLEHVRAGRSVILDVILARA